MYRRAVAGMVVLFAVLIAQGSALAGPPTITSHKNGDMIKVNKDITFVGTTGGYSKVVVRYWLNGQPVGAPVEVSASAGFKWQHVKKFTTTGGYYMSVTNAGSAPNVAYIGGSVVP